jgi:hypothetical protein
LAFFVALIVSIIDTVVKIRRIWQSQTEVILPPLDAQKSAPY